MMSDLDMLEELAKKASSGPWSFTRDTEGEYSIILGFQAESNLSREDAEYISHLSPEVILALISAARK